MAMASVNDEGSYQVAHFNSPDTEGQDVYTGDGSVDVHGMTSVKNRSGNWRTCPFTLGTELCERLAFFGINQNLVTYLTSKLHLGNAAAAKNVTNWLGASYLTSILGAFLADTFWGRYNTIAVSSIVYIIGMVALTLSASISALQPPSCSHDGICPRASTLEYGLFFGALYLIALGAGGIKPCVPSFGADQFDDTDSEERKKRSSFFNWFYFSANLGPVFATTIIVWVQDNIGWGWGYGIPTVFMVLSIISFFCGTPLYRFQKPRGSPLTRVCQVIVAALFNWNKDIPKDDSLLYEDLDKHSVIQRSQKLEHTNSFRCLDKAAIVTEEHAPMLIARNSWKLCTVTQVEELKVLIRLFPIWLTGIISASVFAQLSSVFVQQGMFMDSKIGSFKISPASVSLFNQLTVLSWVPIYDRIIVPVACKYTGQARGFAQLQRIGIGLVFHILAMIVAAIVETVRLNIARHRDLIHDTTPVPMSILWQIPQYSLIGVGEVFNFVGLLEFFYDQAPNAMQSMCTALVYLSSAAGAYLSSFIVSIVTAVSSRGGKPGWISDNLNEGHLDYYYWVLAALNLFNFLAFIALACGYKYKKHGRCSDT